MEFINQIISQIDFSAYWSVFFFGIVIATAAMSTGVDGAVFWAPVLLLVYKLDPAVAISCAIFIELFGFGSGIIGYAKRKKIQYKQALYLLLFTIPFGVLGAYSSKIIPSQLLIFIIGLVCIMLVFMNFHRARQKTATRDPKDLSLISKKLGGIMSCVGGFFAGAVGVGIGESNNYYLLQKNKFPLTYATGTTVFMIAMTDLFCSIFNFIYLNKFSSSFNFSQVLSILVYAIPAVIIGARFGVIVAHNVQRKYFDYALATVFMVMAMISFYRVSATMDQNVFLASITAIFN